MRQISVSKDLDARRNEYFFKPPRFLLASIEESMKDKRDVPMVYLMYNILLITFPAAIFVFWSRSPWIGLFYVIGNMILFQERFILALHFMSHRGVFKNRVFDWVITLLYTPFFGLPSGLYYTHHVVMHHTENNLVGWDLSSTEPFQRDNFLHFLFYWLRFMTLIWVELPFYAWKRGRNNLALGLVAAVVFFWMIMVNLFTWNPTGIFWVFIVPTLINSFLLMLGNWSQHIFIDPKKPRCNFHLAFNVINSDSNQRTFNDGYHVEHHLNSRRHWSELPTSFVENIPRYAEEDAIVFEGLDFIGVGLLVFFRRYAVLAAHLIHFGDTPRTASEVEAFLRARLVPIVR